MMIYVIKNIPLFSALNKLVAGVLALFIIHAPGAFAKDNTVQEVQAVAVWAQDYGRAYQKIIYLFDAEALGEIVAAAEDFENNPEKFNLLVLDWSANLDTAILNLEQAAKDLPPPPKVSFSNKINKLYQAYYDGFADIISDSVESALHLKTAFNRIRKGDHSGVVDILLAQQNSAEKMVLGENAMLESNVSLLKKSSPSYWYLKIMLADNRGGLAEIAITKLDILDNSNLATRKPYVKAMRKQNTLAREFLSKGRKTIAPMRTQLQKDLAGLKNDRVFVENVMLAIDEFNAAFNIEAEIIAINQELADGYARDISAEELEAIEEVTTAKYLKALERRFANQQKRAQLVAQTGQ